MSTEFPPIGSPGTGRRRPRGFWYAIGAALIVIGVIATITLFVVVLLHLMGRAPTDEHTFGNKEQTTVHLGAGASKTIYVTNGTYSPSSSCTAASAGAGPDADLSSYNAQVTLGNWRHCSVCPPRTTATT